MEELEVIQKQKEKEAQELYSLMGKKCDELQGMNTYEADGYYKETSSKIITISLSHSSQPLKIK